MLNLNPRARLNSESIPSGEKKEETKPVPNLKVQVLDFLSREGPSYPVKIGQGVGRESYFVGAVLSELMQLKKIKLSHAKVGGSRLYYLPGQEEKLSILYDYLPDAEKNAYDLLKEKNVVRASETTPVMRVALENIPDFSKPIDIGGERAWKWYLFEGEISPQQPTKETTETLKQIATEVQPTPKKEIEKPEVKIEKPRQELKVEKPKVKKKPEETQKQIVPKSKPTKEDSFSKQVESYFSKNNIKILEKEVIRKNSESNFVIKVASQIGPLELFVYAKNKKKISDQDLMLAHQKGQNRKLPTLFLSTGEQTKKSKEYLAKTLKGYVVFKKL